MKTKITKKAVERLEAHGRELILWDSQIPGFGVRVQGGGAKRFFLYYRIGGRQRRPSIGRFGALTVEEARGIALEWLVRVKRGDDPSAERKAARTDQLTFSEFAKSYVADYSVVRNKPRTVSVEQWRLDKYILPAMGARGLKEIDRQDVLRLQREISNRPVLANRVLATLSAMLNKAEQWGLRREGSNPCRGVAKFREKARQRFLSAEEFGRLAQALEEAEATGAASAEAVAAIRVLIFTGARVGEILGLTWPAVDFENHCLRLGDSKTGPKTIYLNTVAMEVLAGLAKKAQAGDPVIQGRLQGRPMVNIAKPWNCIRRLAGLPDVHLHDLRHCVATTGARLGLGLTTVGLLLGHKSPEMTLAYSHLAADVARDATERIAAAIESMMAGGARVVDVAPGAAQKADSAGERQ